MNNLVVDVKANPRDFYRYINSQKKKKKKKKKKKTGKLFHSVKKRGGNGVAELDPERADELIGQFNDAFNKTEYSEVPLTRRSAPFWIVLRCLQKE